MEKLIEVLKTFFFHPITKGILSVLFVFVSGILGSALVTEITGPGNQINWAKLTNTVTFYLILGVVILTALYNYNAASRELNYRAEFDDLIVAKFIEKNGIDNFAIKINEAIESGDNDKLDNILKMKDTFTSNLGRKK